MFCAETSHTMSNVQCDLQETDLQEAIAKLPQRTDEHGVVRPYVLYGVK